jgi:hypothetical protein
MSDFDFDSWCKLAQRNPAAFFRARSRAIDDLIASYPPVQSQRLIAFQKRIDCIRARSGTPMNALGCMAVMIRDRLQRLEQQNAALEALTRRLAIIALRSEAHHE